MKAKEDTEIEIGSATEAKKGVEGGEVGEGTATKSQQGALQGSQPVPAMTKRLTRGHPRDITKITIEIITGVVLGTALQLMMNRFTQFEILKLRVVFELRMDLQLSPGVAAMMELVKILGRAKGFIKELNLTVVPVILCELITSCPIELKFVFVSQLIFLFYLLSLFHIKH